MSVLPQFLLALVGSDLMAFSLSAARHCIAPCKYLVVPLNIINSWVSRVVIMHFSIYSVKGCSGPVVVSNTAKIWV